MCDPPPTQNNPRPPIRSPPFWHFPKSNLKAEIKSFPSQRCSKTLTSETTCFSPSTETMSKTFRFFSGINIYTRIPLEINRIRGQKKNIFPLNRPIPHSLSGFSDYNIKSVPKVSAILGPLPFPSFLSSVIWSPICKMQQWTSGQHRWFSINEKARDCLYLWVL